MVTFVISYVIMYLILAALFDHFARKSLTFSQQIAPVDNKIPVSIIIPIRDSNEYTEQCFLSWLNQDYGGDIQFIFSLQDMKDSALEVLSRLKERYKFEVIVTPVLSDFGGKTSNLFHGIAQARYEIFILSDADIVAPPDTIRKTVGILASGNRVVSCLPKHTQPKNSWGNMYSLAWNSAMFYLWAPLMIHGRALGIAGGTVGITRQALKKLGGIERFRSYLAEDLALGKAAKELGFELVLGPSVQSPVGTMTFRKLINNFIRANLVSIHMNPQGLLMTLLTYLFVYGYLILLLVGIARGILWIIALCSILILARLLFLGRLTRLTSGKFHFFPGFLLGDLLTVATFLLALVRPKINWGGITYLVCRGGLLQKVS